MARYGIDRGGPVLECELPESSDGSNIWATPTSVRRKGNDGDFGESTEGIAKPTAKLFREGYSDISDEPNPKQDVWPHSPR